MFVVFAIAILQDNQESIVCNHHKNKRKGGSMAQVVTLASHHWGSEFASQSLHVSFMMDKMESA